MPANACGKRREGVPKVSLASDEQYSYDSARRVTGKRVEVTLVVAHSQTRGTKADLADSGTITWPGLGSEIYVHPGTITVTVSRHSKVSVSTVECGGE